MSVLDSSAPKAPLRGQLADPDPANTAVPPVAARGQASAVAMAGTAPLGAHGPCVGLPVKASLLTSSEPPGALTFRAINRRDAPDYDPGLQRHHILPRQLLSQRCFGALFDSIGRERVGFDDFRSNGLLLPASDSAALRLGLPLHRGPHRSYNAMVIERVGQVEASWSNLRLRAPEVALDEALLRLGLLQRALRRRLLSRAGKPLALNRFDPQGRPVDFSELDAMAEALWGASGLG